MKAGTGSFTDTVTVQGPVGGTINVKKYEWADAEGFTQDQMIDDLSGEVFSLIGVVVGFE